jgi:hypothetical protein
MGMAAAMPLPLLAVPGEALRFRSFRREERVVERVVLPEPGTPAIAMR